MTTTSTSTGAPRSTSSAVARARAATRSPSGSPADRLCCSASRAVFAAAMSTLSSSLNSSAAAAVADFYQPWARRTYGEPAPQQLLAFSRRVTIVFGLVQIAVGIGASHLSRSVVGDALAIAGFAAGILLGVFALGMLTRSTHQRGVLVGMIIGILALTCIKFATPLAWPWFAIVGATATFVSGYLASLLIPR